MEDAEAGSPKVEDQTRAGAVDTAPKTNFLARAMERLRRRAGAGPQEVSDSSQLSERSQGNAIGAFLARRKEMITQYTQNIESGVQVAQRVEQKLGPYEYVYHGKIPEAVYVLNTNYENERPVDKEALEVIDTMLRKHNSRVPALSTPTGIADQIDVARLGVDPASFKRLLDISVYETKVPELYRGTVTLNERGHPDYDKNRIRVFDTLFKMDRDKRAEIEQSAVQGRVSYEQKTLFHKQLEATSLTKDRVDV